MTVGIPHVWPDGTITTEEVEVLGLTGSSDLHQCLPTFSRQVSEDGEERLFGLCYQRHNQHPHRYWYQTTSAG